MASLYERTDLYDLFDTERKYQQTIRHWETVFENRTIHSFLDVSIGTGSLTLPLAEMGVELYGSDLSETMLAKCADKAASKGLGVTLRQSDFRNVASVFDKTFDCVASTGNSLPHVPNGDVLVAIEQMSSLVASGGYLYLDTRNWDKILSERKRFWLYNPSFTEDTRINCVQVWDYHADMSMDFNILYSFEKDNRITETEVFTEHYYPIRREMVVQKLKELGYRDIRILCLPAFVEYEQVDLLDWYCVVAQKG